MIGLPPNTEVSQRAAANLAPSAVVTLDGIACMGAESVQFNISWSDTLSTGSNSFTVVSGAPGITTSAALFDSSWVGAAITGDNANITDGTTIASVTNSTTAVMSANAVGSVVEDPGVLTFTLASSAPASVVKQVSFDTGTTKFQTAGSGFGVQTLGSAGTSGGENIVPVIVAPVTGITSLPVVQTRLVLTNGATGLPNLAITARVVTK